MLQRILGVLTVELLAARTNASTSPPEDSLAVPLENDACTKEFVPLREEAVARGKLIKAASERHAGVAE